MARQTLSGARDWATLVATVVDDKLRFAKSFMATEAQAQDLRLLMQEPADEVALMHYVEGLRARANHFGFVNTVLVADTHARVLAAAPLDRMKAVIGRSYPYREWFNGERDFLEEKETPREPRRELGLTLAYESTQEDKPMLIALATPVWSEPGGEILGVLQSTINLNKFNQWLVSVETKDGECPVRFALLLNRDQLIRHPCPGENPLPRDGYGKEASVAPLLLAGTAENFKDPLGSGGRYFAATSRFVENRDWTALVLHEESRALPKLWLMIVPGILLAGVTAWVGYLLTRDR
jgi:hypothetical protein